VLGETRYLKRPHPPGHAGIRSSLKEVALAMGRGRADVDVLRWGRNVIERARIERGHRADTPRKRAELLLDEAQSKVWTPDPVGVEFVPAARLLACDLATKEKDCFATDDCDGRAGLLGAALLSVGIDVVAVGHSYTDDHVVSHVLDAAWIDGAWHYADPTLYQEPLGTVVDFTHEIVLEPFTGTVLCEGRRCLGSLPNRIRSYIAEGTFVGVSGGFVIPNAPLVLIGGREPPPLAFLGQDEAETFGHCKDVASGSKDSDEFVEKAAGCAAEAYCAAYGIPPQACGTIGAFVGEYTVKAWHAGLDAISATFGLSSTVKYHPSQNPMFQRLAKLHNDLRPMEAKWTWQQGADAWKAAYVKLYGPMRTELLVRGSKRWNEEVTKRAVAEAVAAAEIRKPDPSTVSRSSSSSSAAAPLVVAAGIVAAAWLL
jgi:hypothetical protein